MLFSGRRRLRQRDAVAIGALLASTIVIAGCVVGPDTGPNVVRGDLGDDAAADTPVQPALQAPTGDLNWKSCGDDIAKKYDATVPSGVTIDCATYDVPVSTQNRTGTTVRVGAVRARSEDTPKDAAPLVLTSGSDLPSSRTLLAFADGAGRTVVDTRPVVAIDHRGTGTSGLVDCLTTAQRTAYTDNAADAGRDTAERADRLAESARAAADQCNDTLSPDQLDYAPADAANDLEQLRNRWKVDRLAILAIGSGSSVALEYAAEHADRVGRLILDSPVGYRVNAKDAARTRARGLQAALAAFALRCSGVGCALGPQGEAVLGRLLSGGAEPRDGALSDTRVLAAVTTALAVGDTSPDGLKSLGAALAAADRGDTARLTALADDARSLRLTDGQILTRCNAMTGRVAGNAIGDLARDWSDESPLTATTTAMDLLRCDGWGEPTGSGTPDRFAVAPLILVGKNDPINGGLAADSLAPLLLSANANETTVTWNGLGYSVAAHSSCAVDVVDEYLGAQPLGAPAQRTCGD